MMNSIILNQIVSVYLIYTSIYFVAYVVICSSFELKVSRLRAYVTGFLCSNFYTITNTLSLIFILNGTVPETPTVILIQKIIEITAEFIMIFFLINVVSAWYRVYWFTFVIFTFTSLSYQLFYVNNFVKKSNDFYEILPVSFHNLTPYLLTIIINIMVGIILSLIARYAIHHIKIKPLPKWIWLTIYIAFGVLVLTTDRRYLPEHPDSDFDSLGYFNYFMLFFASMTILTMLFITYSNMRYLKLENNLLKKQKELQYTNYISLQQKELKLHALYLDMGQHMKTLQLMISSGENQEVNAYTKNLLEEYRNLHRTYYCDNKIINAVLIQKNDICLNHQIEFDIDISIPAQLSVRDMDLMSVYANLLDNAIEGCLRNKEDANYIKVRTLMVGDYFTVKVMNSKSPLEHSDNSNKDFLTSKKDKTMHGYGMKIIKEIVGRYEGKMEFTAQGNEFSSMVMLKVTL